MRTLMLVALHLAGCGQPEADCADNIDNDEDGVVDCEDEDCASAPDCQETVDTGPLPPSYVTSCPLNSGWPCSCDLEMLDECQDGSSCFYGVCMPSCEVDGESCPSPGQGDASESVVCTEVIGYGFCTLLCDSDGDCPPGQACSEGDEMSACIGLDWITQE